MATENFFHAMVNSSTRLVQNIHGFYCNSEYKLSVAYNRYTSCFLSICPVCDLDAYLSSSFGLGANTEHIGEISG